MISVLMNSVYIDFWLSLLKFLTKLSDEELKNWKLAIKLNLLLMVKHINFSNPFSITFILRLICLVIA